MFFMVLSDEIDYFVYLSIINITFLLNCNEFFKLTNFSSILFLTKIFDFEVPDTFHKFWFINNQSNFINFQK